MFADNIAMSRSKTILNQYQTIANLSGKMVQLARENQWDEVVATSQAYSEAVNALRQYEPLDDSDRLARKPLLQKILQDDAEIRELAAPELVRLGSLLGSMRRHQNVLQTYLAPPKSRP
jgi:flagellar protein FliT|tara:strand:- start:74116 stop:74472 length:357 start_codon:yes stop_codon:yes gene_type:complete